MPILRAVFRSAIPDFIRMGYSANRMIREAQGWGVSYRRTDMLSDVREFLGRYVKEAAVRRVPYNQIIPRSAMAETDLKGVRRYRVWAEEHYTDRYTGQEQTEVISLYDDELRTMNEWEADYMEKQQEDPTDPRKEDRSLVFRCVEHDRESGY